MRTSILDRENSWVCLRNRVALLSMDEGRLVGTVDREECDMNKIELLMVSKSREPYSTYLIKEFCNPSSKRPLREEEVCESKLIFFFFLFALVSGCLGSTLLALGQTFSYNIMQSRCCRFMFLTVTSPSRSEVL